MSDAVLVATAEGVLTALNAEEYSQKFTAVRSYAQWQQKFDVAEAAGLRVDIVPVSKLEAELETRGSIGWSPRSDIIVRKKFGDADLSQVDGKPKNESVDPLILLVEEIFASLVARRIAAGDAAAWSDEEILAAYLPSHLREKHQFTGWIRVTHAVQSDL